MTRHLHYAVSLGLLAAAMPLCAADRPHTLAGSQSTIVWTNDDLEKPHSLGLISIVGRIEEKTSTSDPVPPPYVRTDDPEWHAVQAATLPRACEGFGLQLNSDAILKVFIVNQPGTIYEKDLGPNTTKLAQAMTAHDSEHINELKKKRISRIIWMEASNPPNPIGPSNHTGFDISSGNSGRGENAHANHA